MKGKGGRFAGSKLSGGGGRIKGKGGYMLVPGAGKGKGGNGLPSGPNPGGGAMKYSGGG
jgi:hypothetical protein